jgi:hypothetical protein
MTNARLASAAALFSLLLTAPRAMASVAFPEALRQELELSAIVPPAPGCRLCHKDDVGGLKTVTTPFGRSMLAAGTTAANVSGMVASLRILEADGTDSDRDGVGDIVELQAGTDPNGGQLPDGSSVDPVRDVPLPETGCSLTGAGTGPASGTATWGALALFWMLARALRR